MDTNKTKPDWTPLLQNKLVSFLSTMNVTNMTHTAKSFIDEFKCDHFHVQSISRRIKLILEKAPPESDWSEELHFKLKQLAHTMPNGSNTAIVTQFQEQIKPMYIKPSRIRYHLTKLRYNQERVRWTSSINNLLQSFLSTQNSLSLKDLTNAFYATIQPTLYKKTQIRHQVNVYLKNRNIQHNEHIDASHNQPVTIEPVHDTHTLPLSGASTDSSISNIPNKSNIVNNPFPPIEDPPPQNSLPTKTKRRKLTKWPVELDQKLDSFLSEQHSRNIESLTRLFQNENQSTGIHIDQIRYRIRLLLKPKKDSVSLGTPKKRKREPNSVQTLPKEKFRQSIMDVPTHDCFVCERLFFTYQLKKPKTEAIDTIMELNPKPLLTTNINICNSCYKSLSNHKCPTLASPTKIRLNNTIPDVSDLSQLEERLIAPRQVFAQLYKLKGYGQFGMQGSIINVPANVDNTQSKLPRSLICDSTLDVIIKKKLSYRSAYLSGTVRPQFIMQCLLQLLPTKLYHDEKIEVDEEWLSKISQNPKQPTSKNQNLDDELIETQCQTTIDTPSDTDMLQENEDTVPTDTFLQNFIDANTINNMHDKILTIAPSEGYSPLALFKDTTSEELNFPSLFHGEPRDKSIYDSFTYHKIAKYEIQHKDRRFAIHAPNLFFKITKIMIQIIASSCNIRLRKAKLQGRNLTAKHVKDHANLKKLLESNIGYKDLRTLRTTPDYYDQLRKNLFAMIRQLGPPTLFLTFSAAETRWKHLMKALHKMHTKELKRLDIPFDYESLSNKHLIALLRLDPVTVSKYYANRISSLLEFLTSDPSTIGHVEDYFTVTEFQSRGSPHEHVIVWLKNAPSYNGTNAQDIAKFVDKIITSDKQKLPTKFDDVQTHNCTSTCRKHNKAPCRFHYPIPPMSRTIILQPFKASNKDTCNKNNIETNQKLNSLKHTAKIIAQNLQGLNINDNITFDTFLTNMNINEHTYIQALRTTIQKPTLFLKRHPRDSRTNTFNTVLADMWKANTDIQYILDPYAAASYCTSYITKMDRTMTREMKLIIKDSISSNETPDRRVRKLGSAFLNAQQMSAQLAAFLILSLPLYRSSRPCEFIPTTEMEHRTILLKTTDNLTKLNDDDPNISCETKIDKYIKFRQQKLESAHICLADFVSIHFMRKQGETSKPRIIRWVQYDKEKDPEQWCREQLLLFQPFPHNEISDLKTHDTWENSYNSVASHILVVKRNYIYEHPAISNDQWENIEETLQHIVIDLQHRQEESIQHHLKVTNNEEGIELIDLNNEFSNTNKNRIGQVEISKKIHIMDTDSYHTKVLQLNTEQRLIYDDIMYTKYNDINERLSLFITGKAGTGKTFVLSPIIQGLYRLYSRQVTQDLSDEIDSVLILIMAATGKAAYNIDGQTIHSSLHFNPHQKLDTQVLSPSLMDTLIKKYTNLRLIIVDEISLVGSKMLFAMDNRFRAIKRDYNTFFGGLDVIFIGDLHQVQPVLDDWIFQRPKDHINAIAANFWLDDIKCYELHQTMRQKDSNFIHILNRFRTSDHTEADINYINRTCYKRPPNNTTFPHIFYTNDQINNHNNNAFQNTSGQPVQLIAKDTRIDGKSVNDTQNGIQTKPKKQTAGLHKNVQIKKGMLVEICATNYDTNDGIVNGADGIFQGRRDIDGTPTIWIQFLDSRAGIRHRKETPYPEDAENTGNHSTKNWTPIHPITKQVQLGKSQINAYTRTQFPIQLAAARSVHRTQGTTMEKLAFDPRGCTKHGLCYTALSRIKSIENLYLLSPLQMENFTLTTKVIREMERLRTTASWQTKIPYLPAYKESHFIVQSLNTNSLRKHRNNIYSNPNLLASQILCLQETKTWSTIELDKLIDLTTHRYVNVTGSHGLIMIYNKSLIPLRFKTQTTTSGSEIILASFQLKPNVAINIITLYKNHSTKLKAFQTLLSSVLNQVPLNERLIILGDFNINALNHTQSFEWLQAFLDTFKLKIKFTTSVSSVQTQLDHIWTNIPCTDSDIHGTGYTYWTDKHHQPIFYGFKLG